MKREHCRLRSDGGIFTRMVSYGQAEIHHFGKLALVVALGASVVVDACSPVDHPDLIGPAAVETTPFDPQIKIVGDAAHRREARGGTVRWLLRSFIDKKTAQRTHQIYIVDMYAGNWRFYDAATDEHANAMPLETIDRNVLGCYSACVLTETVVVTIQENVLRQFSDVGFTIQLSSHSGYRLFVFVLSSQIMQQLKAVDRGLDQTP